MEFSLGALVMLLLLLFYLRRGVSSEKGSAPDSDGEGGVIVTYSKHIPGYEVRRILGPVESSSVVPLEGDYPLELAEEATLEKLMDKAKDMGANAILELKMEREEFATHIRIVARGLAVKI